MELTRHLRIAENGFTSKPEGESEDNDEDDDYVDMEDLDEDDLDFSTGSAIAIEKEVATDSLLEIFRSTKQHFLPYVESVVKELLILLEHFWDGIRKAAATTLLSFIATYHDMAGLPKWTPGIKPQAFPSELNQLIEAIMPKVIEMWEEEDDRDVVNSLCEDFQVLVEKLGPGIVVPNCESPLPTIHASKQDTDYTYHQTSTQSATSFCRSWRRRRRASSIPMLTRTTSRRRRSSQQSSPSTMRCSFAPRVTSLPL